MVKKFGIKGGKKKKKGLPILATYEDDGVEYELLADSYASKYDKGETNHVLILHSPNTNMRDTKLRAPKFLAFAAMVDAGLRHLASPEVNMIDLPAELEVDDRIARTEKFVAEVEEAQDEEHTN